MRGVRYIALVLALVMIVVSAEGCFVLRTAGSLAKTAVVLTGKAVKTTGKVAVKATKAGLKAAGKGAAFAVP